MAEIRTYTQEFKDSAVEMVRTQGMSIPKAAGGLGIPPNTLRGWIEAADGRKPAPRSPQRAGSAGDSALQQRVRELEAEVRQLRIDREILKKATQWFAKGSS
ncbi:MAG: transposase [Phycisphaerales bacterium]